MVDKSGIAHRTADGGRQDNLAPSEASPPAGSGDLSRSDLLAHLSHAMRTPLGVILGFAQLLESATPPPTPAQKRHIEQILEAGWYLEKIIDMTHQLALIESGNSTLALAAMPLAAVIADCRRMIGLQAHLSAVHVNVPWFATPCCVVVDPTRLQQALGHLLTTVTRHHAEERVVVVDFAMSGPEWIRIGIDDTGIAASAPQRTRPGRMSAGEDREIALLLARRLVESMGGAIRAGGPAGSGTMFSVDLQRVMDPKAASRLDATGTPAANPLERCTR